MCSCTVMMNRFNINIEFKLRIISPGVNTLFQDFLKNRGEPIKHVTSGTMPI